MNLGEYLWRKRKTYKKFSEEVEICHRSTAQYVTGEFTASLLSAIKIVAMTSGEVGFIDLLSKSDLDKLYDFLTNLPEKIKNHTSISDMHKSISLAKKSRENVDLD